MTEILKYQPGTVLCFTCGAYSDFNLCGSVVTIKECDLPKLVGKFKEWKRLPENQSYSEEEADPSDFPSFLIVSGYAMPLDCQEVHLGEYSTFEDEFNS
jgi:hypothetical protein